MLHQLFGRKSLKKTASTHDFLYEKTYYYVKERESDFDQKIAKNGGNLEAGTH